MMFTIIDFPFLWVLSITTHNKLAYIYGCKKICMEKIIVVINYYEGYMLNVGCGWIV